MIGLDTNVIVRYFAQDHEKQSARASAVIDSLTSEEPGFISTVTLVEMVWVMQGAYKASKAEIAQILLKLLQTREIIVQDADIALQALSRFTESKAGFADCLIERIGHRHGCAATVTFDADAATTAGMRHLLWE
ncbi:MAG: type II toxin-antitoxin system VapC family toxin [Burkholderiaceae bacterium]|nr:type II toxin-antitoxin system VapC family toxin [Burkholderiaceae bacterium]